MYRLLILLFCACGSLLATEKMYFDLEEMPTDESEFHIHIGHNEWVKTKSIHRDMKGFFTYARNIVERDSEDGPVMAREWKCPYCHNYWPIGTPCQNPDCPSKYKS